MYEKTEILSISKIHFPQTLQVGGIKGGFAIDYRESAQGEEKKKRSIESKS